VLKEKPIPEAIARDRFLLKGMSRRNPAANPNENLS
jgi:hypothetical protein